VPVRAIASAVAREWDLPEHHIRALEAWLGVRSLGAGNRKLEDAR
jgi:hypothetical protein